MLITNIKTSARTLKVYQLHNRINSKIACQRITYYSSLGHQFPIHGPRATRYCAVDADQAKGGQIIIYTDFYLYIKLVSFKVFFTKIGDTHS